MGVPNVLKVRGTAMDPVSVVACSWVLAGIPQRGTKRMLPVKNCRGYNSAQQSSGGQAWRTDENFFAKAWHYCPSSATASQFIDEMLSR